MEYFAYIVIGFTGIQLLVSTVNLLFRQNIHGSNQYNSLVSILIPARDEEANIGKLLSDLQKQDYKNIEIIVYDDHSSDKTGEVVKSFVLTDSRVKLIHSENLPYGWLGKNYGCHVLSQNAKGEFLLFLDADVRISNDIINRTIHQITKHRLGLLSVFPRQVMKTPGEQFTVPLMNYILLTLLPLILVRKTSNASLSAANGQYMFFTTDLYMRMLPHQALKNSKVEDIGIARYYKRNNIRTACLASSPDISCRMYDEYYSAVNGFSKNVVMFFGNSFILTILFWIVTTLGFIPILLVYKTSGLIIFLLAMALIRVNVSITSNQSVIINLIFHYIQQLSLGVVIVKAFQQTIKKEYIWKGRNIY